MPSCKTVLLAAAMVAATAMCTPAFGAATSPAGRPQTAAAAKPPNAPPKSAPIAATTPPAVASPTPADLAALRNEIADSKSDTIAAIKESQPSWWERFIPPAVAFLGILVAGIWGAVNLGRQMRHGLSLQQQQLTETERIGRAKSAFDALAKISEYQFKQLNEFYSPLLLLLHQVSGVRKQLCDQLIEASPDRFVYVEEPDEREHLYVRLPDGQKKRFRLVEHLRTIAGSHAQLLPLVEEIVGIGEQMVELIRTKGGLSMAGNEELSRLLGRYLAHFSILRDVAKKAKEQPQLLTSLTYNVSYPVELDEALKKDLRMLVERTTRWTELTESIWNEANKQVEKTDLQPNERSQAAADRLAS